MIVAMKNIAALRAAAAAQVDAQAEQQRLLYITPGAGMAMVYTQKLVQAQAYQAAVAGGTTLDPTQYPLLANEVGITASTIGGVAQAVAATAAQWTAIAAFIETQRLTAKAAIAAAATPAAITAAAIVQWTPPMSPPQPPAS